MDELQQARLNVERAEKRMKVGSCGCFGESITSKAEGSIKLYEQASVVFIREKQYEEAGKCLEEIAHLKDRLNMKSDEDYLEAAHIYSFVNKEKSVKLMQDSVKKYQNEGKHSKAAEVFENLGKHFEEKMDFPLSVKFFENASESYSLTRGNKFKENSCRIKATDLSCINELGEWKQHVEVYEVIAKQYLLDQSLKYSAKDFFFKIVCLYLIYDDYVQANACLNTYKGQDPSLSGSNECDFLTDTINAFKNRSKQDFEKSFIQFKNTSNIEYDPWRKKMINKLYLKFDNNVEKNDKVEEDEYLNSKIVNKKKKEEPKEDDFL